MKASDFHPYDEEGAADWAHAYFGIYADAVKCGNNYKELLPYYAHLLFPDTVRHALGDEACLDRAVKIAVSHASNGARFATEALLGLAAELINRGEPVPEPLRNFIVGFLSTPTMRVNKPGPSGGALLFRNAVICEAIRRISATWNYPPTRNEATDEYPSAASIVSSALKSGADIDLVDKTTPRTNVRFWR